MENSTHNNKKEDVLKKSVVLVVEDDFRVRISLGLLLDDYGYETILAENGNEGLRLFNINKDRIDRVLTDNDMPFMSGVDLIKEIRKTGSNVHICLMSGGMTDLLHSTAIEAGATTTLSKPAGSTGLLQALNL